MEPCPTRSGHAGVTLVRQINRRYAPRDLTKLQNSHLIAKRIIHPLFAKDENMDVFNGLC